MRPVFCRTGRNATKRLRLCQRYATAAAHEVQKDTNGARWNDVGVQQLSQSLHQQLFPNLTTQAPADQVSLSRRHLSDHGLLRKTSEKASPISFELPPMHGATMDEHFHRIGMEAAEPYLQMTKEFSKLDLPRQPRRWVRQTGWVRYSNDGRSQAMDFPDEKCLVFDVEVLYKVSPFPVMAVAASSNAWYAWLSPWLLGESKSDRHLVPLGDVGERIVVGHNIGYDRAKTREEYSIEPTKTFWQDTMSLHVAVNGMCSRQRPTWMKHKKRRELKEKISSDASGAVLNQLLGEIDVEEEQELWVDRSSINSLRDVAKFHCNVTIDKQMRDHFSEMDLQSIVSRLDELMDYCAADVAITHRVYQKVMPAFLEVCPHPVSFAALRHLLSVFLPVDTSWPEYVQKAENTYLRLLKGVKDRLVSLAERAVELRKQPEKYASDPWLAQLDWNGQGVKLVKDKKTGEMRLPLRRKKPGMPNWYRDLFDKNDSEIALTVRTRIAPMLLRLSWEGHPLIWTDSAAWVFRVPRALAAGYEQKNFTKADLTEDPNTRVRDDFQHVYFRVPHKDGPAARCGNPLAKGYVKHFEDGILRSEYAYAREALDMNAACSYWISARERIMGQVVVWEDENVPLSNVEADKKVGIILPQLIPMGTITRRAVENTWLTASNAKKNRVGSELKAMVKAPKGYKFVGADVDSEELWIASLIGDAQFKLHGGTALGWMTLEGTKSAGTDLHSRTADILGTSRNDAKVFNYGRIYGAGLKFAVQLLRMFNPKLTEKEAQETAARLYKVTKGQKSRSKLLRPKSFWRGGTESFVFNRLEEIADQEKPRTPVLGAAITQALMRRYINAGGFMTSRINWAIQSSGVDYLHLLIISMDHLIKHYGIRARLSLTVHDEIRYLAKEEDAYRAAFALQVSNLWTRAMFCQQMGINDVPQSCAFFSAVDIDHVLRKEVDMDCSTPSHPEQIAPGESCDMETLLAKEDLARLVPHDPKPDLSHWPYRPRTPVLDQLSQTQDMGYLKAQACQSDTEYRDMLKVYRKKTDATKKSGAESKSYYREFPQYMELPAVRKWTGYSPHANVYHRKPSQERTPKPVLTRRA